MSTTSSAIKLLLGPILIGVALNTFLYGICVTQFVHYYLSKRQNEDSVATRCLVAWEFFIDTFHSAASIYFIWLYLVDNFLNAAFLEAAPWPLTAVPLLIALSACPIQMFLIYRVYSLSNSGWMSAVLGSLTVASGGLATTTSVLAFRVEDFSAGARLKPVADAWLGLSVANDLAITLALVYYLHASRTGLSQTNTLINRLIRSAIESAAVAPLFAILISFTFTRYASTGLHLMFSIPLGRVYTNTLLSTLNRRESLRKGLDSTRDGPFIPTSSGFRSTSSGVVFRDGSQTASGFGRSTNAGLVVNIMGETEMETFDKLGGRCDEEQ
ncbi:hypothetical protein DFH06DRAFT_716207 [Mycena polygramma]|nr:hypothetical protein DFH06DRAFT_716207 [Mycena polygramma]